MPGCASVAHVFVEVDVGSGGVSLSGTADARVSRGLVALVVGGLDGCTVEQVLAVATRDVVDASRLSLALGPSRANGLASVIAEIQKRVRACVAEGAVAGLDCAGDDSKGKEHGVHADDVRRHPLDGRWSDRQGEDVAVLLSGGVDSSVAMRLVMESGARPHPFYLKIWLGDELEHLGECPWEEDMAYATAVCEQAGVKLRDVPMQKEYWDEVVSYTMSEARIGRTPNPDVMCNSRIKFGVFYDRIGKDYDKVATGHYARRDVCAETGLAQLRMSEDSWKDQTYFLAHLRQDQLAHAVFPVGEYTKQQVRELAERYSLPNKTRKDSQGICFLGKLKFDDFLGHHLGQMTGPLVEFETGETLGEHHGFWFYTLGQRRGVGLSGGPWYVVSKNPEENIVYVSRNYQDSSMERNKFEFEAPLWISGSWPSGLSKDGDRASLGVKTRHGPHMHTGVMTRLSVRRGRVDLAQRDKGLAPGQFAAFYDGDLCLGSGVIATDYSLADAPVAIARVAGAPRLQAHF